MSDEKTMGQIIQIDEVRIRDHLGEMVRGTVEDTDKGPGARVAWSIPSPPYSLRQR